MAKIVLEAQLKGDMRNDVARSEGLVPSVCYGPEKENVVVVVKHNEFLKAYRQAGENAVIDLTIDGKTENVLVQDMQLHPLTGFVEHVDFKFVDMNKLVVAPIPLEFVGKSPAVIDMGGILNKTMTEVEVEALPANLPHHIEVDISKLDDFNAVLHVSDLSVPENVEIVTEMELTIATVTAPRAEEEPEDLLSPEELERQALEAAVGVEEGEEGAEGAEGKESSEGKSEDSE